MVGAVVTMMATCTPRTLEARLPILITLTISLLLERAVVSFILAYIHTDTPQVSPGFVFPIGPFYISLNFYCFVSLPYFFTPPLSIFYAFYFIPLFSLFVLIIIPLIVFAVFLLHLDLMNPHLSLPYLPALE